jgi:hypothetical protein
MSHLLRAVLASAAALGLCVAGSASGKPTKLQFQRCQGLVKGAAWTEGVRWSIGPVGGSRLRRLDRVARPGRAPWPSRTRPSSHVYVRAGALLRASFGASAASVPCRRCRPGCFRCSRGRPWVAAGRRSTFRRVLTSTGSRTGSSGNGGAKSRNSISLRHARRPLPSSRRTCGSTSASSRRAD